MHSPEVDVSILVLAYNHAPYIGTCLDSLLAQDFQGTTEILVGEDKSTDETMHILQTYAERNPTIRVVTSAQNVGMHENHRRLLRASRGRFIAYCEGDDYWHRTDKLRLQVEALDEQPSTVGVHSDVDHLMLVDGRPRVLHSRWSTEMTGRQPLTTMADLLRRNTVQTCSALFRAPVVTTYPSSELAHGMYAIDDWPLFLHATSQGPMLFLPSALATYRYVPGSITNQGAAQRARLMADQIRLLTDATRLWPVYEAPGLEGRLTLRRAMVIDALASGDPALVRRAVEVSRRNGLPDDWLTRWVPRVVAVPGVAGALERVADSRRRRREDTQYV